MEKERYEIVRLIGKGLVGGVYEAKDAVLSDRGVAIRRFFNMEEGTNRSDWEEGFLEVAQQLSGVQHPGIVTVFDVGVDDEGAFVVAQLLEGKTFGERLKDGAINEWDVYVTIEGILDALVIAHEAGFMHGSLDPSSIIRVPRASGGYRNVIVDLGLTRLARLIEGQESSSKLMAQPAIMAPEQFDGSAPTVTSDLYMLGQFAYMCLIGGHPFAGQTMEEAAISHKEQELKRLEEYDNGVSKEFSDWVHSLIQKNPADRPQSAEEALKSLPKLNKPIDENIQITSPMTNGLTTSVVQVTPTSHQSGAQQLQTVGIAATVPTSQEAGEKQEQLEPVAEVKKSNKTALIAICSTLCLLFVGLLVLIVMKVNSSNDEVVDNKKSDALKDLSYSTTMTNVAFSGKFISNKSLFKGKKFSRVKKIRIGSNVLDYILMNGRVVDDYRIRNIESNKYFSNVELNKHPDLTETLSTSLVFQVGNTKGVVYAKSCVNSRVKAFEEGSGYKITGRIPEGHNGPLGLRFLVSLSKCDVAVSFRYKRSDGFTDKHSIVNTRDGLYSSNLTVSEAYSGEEFEILITAENPLPNEEHSLTFNGIIVTEM